MKASIQNIQNSKEQHMQKLMSVAGVCTAKSRTGISRRPPVASEVAGSQHPASSALHRLACVQRYRQLLQHGAAMRRLGATYLHAEPALRPVEVQHAKRRQLHKPAVALYPEPAVLPAAAEMRSRPGRHAQAQQARDGVL